MSLKTLLFGKARSLSDEDLFHKLWLTAIFAWVGLGADGLSSSCYGPEEAFKALGVNVHLSLFVALATVVTIFVICASYSQIIALFPSGGGGYLVASKLLSPFAGVVSGSALLIDYVLTITISVASGADALFSILPASWIGWKLTFAVLGLLWLTVMNLRGVKESVLLWAPVFFIFVATHAFAIVYAIGSHAGGLASVASDTVHEVHTVSASVGFFGLLAVIIKAYSMGAGTFTGIEAVSNGLPILQEPRVKTGRKTMVYMGTSLAITVGGLLLAYLLYHVQPHDGQTLNAVLFHAMTAGWGRTGSAFVWVALASEALLLLIAAQTGFLDGPRVLANMAVDRWFPSRFANLSDRFVTQNGVLLMAAAGLVMMLATRGNVDTLVVLYSINVFITFSLSQFGMVRHWWSVRGKEGKWFSHLLINGLGCMLTLGILGMLIVIKFSEGGWVTLVVTGLLIGVAYLVRRHYDGVKERLRRLDAIVTAVDEKVLAEDALKPAPEINPKARTAIVLVNGYNGLGLHTLLNVPRMFGDQYRNYVFVQVGAVDAGNFKGADEIDSLRRYTEESVRRYVAWAHAHGYGSEAYTDVGHDVAGRVMRLADTIAEKYPNRVFFGGQLVFTNETRANRWLHNHLVFNLQRRFFLASLPFVIVPIRVE
ncbi:hypothetical protein GALL_135420 [mine drainage metagenome]|uniref:Amino acid transporter n=1 Tax=mine drainage metagenome TaxID=410659 RepID=A0A1J5SWD5_9ZZZZ